MAPMSPPAKRSCPSCGRVLNEQAQYCVGCGAELPEATGVAEAEQAEPAPAPPAAALKPAVPTVEPPAAPAPPPPAAAVPDPPAPSGGGMVAATAEAVAPQFDRYAGAAPAPPLPPPPSPAPVAPAPAAPPDVSLAGAFHRLARRSPVSAAIVCGLGAMAGVWAVGFGLGLLVRAAHASQGCATGALTGLLQGGCQEPGATNGWLTDGNAMLWSIQGVGVSFSSSAGGLVARIPLPLGMLACISVLAVAGAVSVRLVPPRRLRDVFVRAGLIAAVYTTAMLLLGIAVSARSDRVTVGPDDGLLLLWALLIGFTGSLLGIFKRLFGSALPAAPRAMVRARLRGLSGILEAAIAGTVATFALGAVLGVVAAATHVTDTGNVLRAALLDVTTRPLPSSPTGTVAAVVYLVLGLPALALWVLAYSLIIPTVTVGTPLGSTDYGLVAGDHDAWLWAVVVLPVILTLFTGYVAARRRRSASVEAALLDGGLGGLAFAFTAYLLVVLLDGGATLSLSGLGGIPSGVVGSGFSFGPGLEYTLGALLLWGLVGGAAGGYLSLLLLVRGIRPPLLGRWEIEAPPPAAPPPPPIPCAACGVANPAGGRFCSSCGAPLGPLAPPPEEPVSPG